MEACYSPTSVCRPQPWYRQASMHHRSTRAHHRPTPKYCRQPCSYRWMLDALLSVAVVPPPDGEVPVLAVVVSAGVGVVLAAVVPALGAELPLLAVAVPLELLLLGVLPPLASDDPPDDDAPPPAPPEELLEFDVPPADVALVPAADIPPPAAPPPDVDTVVPLEVPPPSLTGCLSARLAALHPFGFLNPESLNIHCPWGRWCVGVVQDSRASRQT